MARIVCATRNPGKVRELRTLLADVPDLVLVGLDEVPPIADVVEDGDTFEANAIKKAREVARATGMMALADDSGIELDALDGHPGVHSARYAGERATDAENNAKLLAALRGVPQAKRTARYRVVLALADPTGALGDAVHTESGTCEGRIRDEPAGSGGFGYDPHFVPAGDERTMAQLTAAEKNRISHRGQAARKMARFLLDHLAHR